MQATYDDPSANAKDAVRFRIGDTDMTDPYLSDGEIRYCLAQRQGDILAASLLAIRNIVAQLSYTAGNESVGPVSEGGSQGAIDALMKTYDTLMSEAGVTADVLFTGISVEDKLCPDAWATRSAFARPLNPLDPPTPQGYWPYNRWLVSGPVDALFGCEED